jgi:hypothetical protein
MADLVNRCYGYRSDGFGSPLGHNDTAPVARTFSFFGGSGAGNLLERIGPIHGPVRPEAARGNSCAPNRLSRRWLIPG